MDKSTRKQKELQKARAQAARLSWEPTCAGRALGRRVAAAELRELNRTGANLNQMAQAPAGTREVKRKKWDDRIN